MVAIAMVGTILLSCSTEKDALVNRWFHGTNAHYNGYFNAVELIDKSLTSYKDAYQEDYTNILPVFVIPDEFNKSAVQPDMNTAIQKVSVVITKHSMPSAEPGNPKRDEYNKWIDENWLVMGQAYYYMRDYADALARFDYIIGMFEEDEIRYWAKLWKARTYIQQEKYDKAASLFRELEDDGSFPKKFEGDFYTAQSDMLLKQGNYQEAADMLMKAIEYTPKKQMRARLTFILAQIHEKLGDTQRASHFYEKVVKLKPTYEMEFYARIFKALSYSGGSSDDLKKELNKMLNDDKNIEYRDQIYYALADIAFKEGDEDLGIEYLQKSAASSVSNTKQKASSFLRLADLYFEKKEYVLAQVYYDSTSSFLDPMYPDYASILNKSHNLNDLVGHLNTIAFQDSVLRLAAMDSMEVIKMINRMIQDVVDGREARAQAQQDQMLMAFDNNQNNTNTTGSTWYFYNPTALAYGFNEFKTRFSDRKLEDNWRRKNKSSGNSSFDEFLEDGDSTATALYDDSLDVNFYLQHIPFGDSAMAEAHDKILNALYDVGVIYKDKLFDNNEARASFEDLVTRYNNRSESVTAHYQLYRLYTTAGNEAKAEYHKDQILTRFPDSEPAIRILNPDLAKDEEKKRLEDEEGYNDVYSNYLYRKYNTVLLACNDVMANDPLNYYIDRYYFLKAMCISELEPGTNTANFEKALADVVERFPDLETGKRAEFILNNIRNQTSVSDVLDGNSSYIYSSGSKHVFVAIFPNSSGSMNQLKVKFSDFHSNYFGLDALKTDSYFLDSDNQIVKVSDFKNMTEAMDYYNAVSINTEEMSTVHENELVYFVITESNFSSFFSEKNIEEYMEFFNENYLNE